MAIERRIIARAPELRAAGESDARTIAGYAAIFNSDADIGGWWIERIAPGAFAGAIGNDVRALIDHDTGRVIGRTTANTLRLAEDDKGLAVEIDLPDTQDGRDIYTLIGRGDVSGMSFGFVVTKQTWDETVEPPVRTIEAVDLFEVSVVAFPAYDATKIAQRSSRDLQDERAKTRNYRGAADRLRRKANLDLRARNLAPGREVGPAPELPQD